MTDITLSTDDLFTLIESFRKDSNASVNQELYAMGQKAIAEAAELKRDVRLAQYDSSMKSDAIGKLLKYIQNLQMNTVDDRMNEQYNMIIKAHKAGVL